jgi:hypothetical protein
MATYTFTVTIEENNDKQPLSNSILERQRLKNEAKERADEINQKVRELRFKALEPYLEKIHNEITEPLGLTAKLYKVERFLHKNSIRISGANLHSDNDIRIYIENSYYEDEFGNSICQVDGFKMTYIIRNRYRGTTTRPFTDIESFYKDTESYLEELYLKNK